jgi:hypothetical protein
MLSFINVENANNINKSNNGVQLRALTFVTPKCLIVLLLNAVL